GRLCQRGAVPRIGPDADAPHARVALRTGVAVVAGNGVGCVDAARRRVAGVGGADVAVVAVGGRPAHAGPAAAGVVGRTGVAVVARMGSGGIVARKCRSPRAQVLGVWTQPDAELQESVVQTLLSSQLGGRPPTHAPPLQASFVVQALPSSHELVLLEYSHSKLVVSSHKSSVHGLPSSQDAGQLL